MMGLGSAVGAGLFLGVGLGIQISGTSVLVSYAIAGALVAVIMWMLGEMAAARPSLGSFSTYAGQAFGNWARFTLGWIFLVHASHGYGRRDYRRCSHYLLVV